jgi:glycosyltransferase involved in cell wall biosynthesis
MEVQSAGSLPLVSVIIPTFNRWPLLREAVASVLAQSYRDFELIIVDDGSTDETAAEFTRTTLPLRYFIQAHRGVSAARNFGVRLARGRYLAFLDSDDLWLPGKLEAQARFFEEHDDVQICQTEEIWMRRGIRVNPKHVHRKPSGDIFLRSLELCLVSPSAVMLTRELFDKMGGFDEAFPVCEDYDLWLRIAQTHQVPLISTPLVVKRGGHADQLSRSMWGMDRYRVSALQKLLRSGLGGLKRERAMAVLQCKLAILAQGARKRGRLDEARDFESMLLEFSAELAHV